MIERDSEINVKKWRFWIFFGVAFATITLVGIVKQVVILFSRL